MVIAVITAGQRLSPTNLQGRVATAVTLLLFAPQPLAPAAGAGLVGFLDYRAIYGLTAAVGLLLAVGMARAGRAASTRAGGRQPVQLEDSA